MKKTMLDVQARPGVRVPREDAPRRYITETPVQVPDTAYYRRRIQDGDLVRLPGSAHGAAHKE